MNGPLNFVSSDALCSTSFFLIILLTTTFLLSLCPLNNHLSHCLSSFVPYFSISRCPRFLSSITPLSLHAHLFLYLYPYPHTPPPPRIFLVLSPSSTPIPIHIQPPNLRRAKKYFTVKWHSGISEYLLTYIHTYPMRLCA